MTYGKSKWWWLVKHILRADVADVVKGIDVEDHAFDYGIAALQDDAPEGRLNVDDIFDWSTLGAILRDKGVRDFPSFSRLHQQFMTKYGYHYDLRKHLKDFPHEQQPLFEEDDI